MKHSNNLLQKRLSIQNKHNTKYCIIFNEDSIQLITFSLKFFYFNTLYFHNIAIKYIKHHIN